MSAQREDVVIERLLGELRIRRTGSLPPDYPIGVLSHHLVHDEAIWSKLDQLLDFLRGNDRTLLMPASQVFDVSPVRTASGLQRSTG